MIQSVLEELGLAKNEAKIYETLLKEGESGVSTISSKAEINRRNVYDSLSRLIEKGLIYEIRSLKENSYKAVDPQKLQEMLSEKKQRLDTVFEDMKKLYHGNPHKEEIVIYRGLEGWKNYLRDILRIGEDTYIIGGTGAWANPKIALFMEQFLREAEKKNLRFHALANYEASKIDWTKQFKGLRPRILPKECQTTVGIEIFGDHVIILPNLSVGSFDEKSSFTVIVNQQIADAFRTWFHYMWKHAEETKKTK